MSPVLWYILPFCLSNPFDIISKSTMIMKTKENLSYSTQSFYVTTWNFQLCFICVHLVKWRELCCVIFFFLGGGYEFKFWVLYKIMPLNLDTILKSKMHSSTLMVSCFKTKEQKISNESY